MVASSKLSLIRRRFISKRACDVMRICLSGISKYRPIGEMPSSLPAHQGRAPGQAGAEAAEHDQTAGFDSAFRKSFVEC